LSQSGYMVGVEGIDAVGKHMENLLLETRLSRETEAVHESLIEVVKERMNLGGREQPRH
jgi:hypothetical protein